MQPIRGIGNIARGAANLVGVPLFFFYNTIRYAGLFFISGGSWDAFKKNMRTNLYRTIFWLLDGLSSLVRGVTQIVAMPLTWFIRMPLRGLITAIKGAPKIEENQGIQRLVADGEGAVNAINNDQGLRLKNILHRLHVKFQKATDRGQNTQINSELEQSLYKEYFDKDFSNGEELTKPEKETAQRYIGLFSKSNQAQKLPGKNRQNTLLPSSSREINRVGLKRNGKAQSG